MSSRGTETFQIGLLATLSTLRAVEELIGTPNLPKRPGKPRKVVASTKDTIPPGKFPTLWTRSLDDLMDAYAEVCAYTCFRIHPVTGARSVDHFFPKSESWDQVYEWNNYRLCCSPINSKKGEHLDVLDPFTIQPNWFVLELVGFQVLAKESLDTVTKARVKATIERLNLDAFNKRRENDAEDYWNHDVSYKVLCRDSPFVAYELKRLGRTNPGD